MLTLSLTAQCRARSRSSDGRPIGPTVTAPPALAPLWSLTILTTPVMTTRVTDRKLSGMRLSTPSISERVRRRSRSCSRRAALLGPKDGELAAPLVFGDVGAAHAPVAGEGRPAVHDAVVVNDWRKRDEGAGHQLEVATSTLRRKTTTHRPSFPVGA